MHNKDLFQKLSSTIADVINGTISTKDANAVSKEAGKLLRQQKKDFKNLERCVKVAKRGDEAIISQKDGSIISYGVPVNSKEFYFEPGIEPNGSFSVNGDDYLVIYKESDWE
jgi:hypothetical protein